MKSIRILFVTGLFLIPVFSFNTLKAGGFKLVRQDEVLSLYERWIPGAGGEKVRELKAVFNVHSDVEKITGLLADQQKGIEWNRNAQVYKILHLRNENTWITYIQYDIPWPFDDQDCSLLYHFTKSAGSGNPAEITFNSVSDGRFPETDKIDRIRGVRGKWVMEELDNGDVQITYLITTNRSRKVPRWISDPIIHENLFSTMTAFKNLVEQS